MIWRPPGLGTSIDIVAQVAGEPKERFFDWATRDGLARALDVPPPDPRLDPQFAVGLSVAKMIQQILCTPQIPDPAIVAERIVRKTLDESGIGWEFKDIEVTFLVNRYDQLDETPAELAEHLRGTFELPPVPAAVNWVKVFGKHRDHPFEPSLIKSYKGDARDPMICVAYPHEYLKDNVEPDLEQVLYHVQRGVERALERMPGGCPVRLLPLGHLAKDAMEPIACEEFFDLLYQADALITCDAGGRGPGFTVGAISAVFRAQYGPALDIRVTGCGGHSDAQDLMGRELDATVQREVASGDRIAAACATWFTDKFETIMRGHRRRLNARLLNYDLRNCIRRGVEQASPEVIEDALAKSHMTLRTLSKLLDNVDYIGALPHSQVATMVRALNVPQKASPRQTRADWRELIDQPTLRMAAEKHKWSEEHVQELLNEAQMELAEVGAERRLKLMDINDWVLLSERLRRKKTA
jgi:hypothetical protein